MSMGLDPLRDVRGVGIDQYRAGLGEYLGAVASDAWAAGPLASAGRIIDTSVANTDAEQSGEAMLSPKEASEQGRTLGISFDQPISRGAYNVIADEKRRQIAAEATFRRARLENGYGTTQWLLGGGTEFLVSAVDPLNIASAFVPVVGEARMAQMAERFGAPLAGLARSGLEGAAGQALLEPIAAANARQQGEDYGMMNALVDVGFGTGLGVALHGAAYGAGAGFRFIRNRFGERLPEMAAPRADLPHSDLSPEPVPNETGERPTFVAEKIEGAPPRQPVAEAMEQLRPETKDTAMHVAVAQLAQDKPVDVGPVLAADPQWGNVKTAIDEASRQHATELQAQSAEGWKGLLPTAEPPPDYAPAPDELKLARRVARGLDPEKPQKAPESLADFVRRAGGLIEGTPEAADVKASDLGKGEKGLVRTKESGRQADHLAQAAQEAGFDVGRATETGSGVDVDGFVKALIEDASGARRHLPDDERSETWRAQQDYFDEFHRHVRDDLGLELKGRDARQVAWLLSREPHTARLIGLAERIDRLDEHASLELVASLDRERAELERQILSEEPGAIEPDAPQADHRETPQATLDELERYYADIDRSLGPREDREPVVEPAAAGGGPAEGEPAAAARPAGRDPAAEAAGLRQQGREGAADAEQGTASDLADWVDRQRAADLHADTDALSARDERLAAEGRETQQLLQDDIRDFGHLLEEEDTRLLFDETGKIFDDESKGMSALAACQMGGR